MHRDASKRLQVAAELKRATRDQELVLQYQPIVDLHTGEIAAVGALVRWDHPNRGLVLPIDFISVAEDTGFDRWHRGPRASERLSTSPIVATTISQGSPPAGSRQSLCQPAGSAFVGKDVARLLHWCGLPNILILEITELMLMHDTDQTIARLNELKALGVQLAVDDFGTGYLSPSYLRGFPVDILEIDSYSLARWTSHLRKIWPCRAPLLHSATG
jgi:EAL domain-containing protein (putative c-di-GMP-specific phosphodiesterase class I)